MAYQAQIRTVARNEAEAKVLEVGENFKNRSSAVWDMERLKGRVRDYIAEHPRAYAQVFWVE